MPQTRIQEKFYPLTSRIINLLRQGNLTAAEWRIWSYLVELDPWGDRYEDFDYLSVMSICNCSKATLYRTIAKFQELKIFDFQARGLCLKNLIGTSQLRKPETEPDPPKNDSHPSTKPKPKPKTKEPPILRQDRPEPPSPPVTSDYPEISDPWDDHPEVSDPWNDEPISEMKSPFQNCNNDFKNEISVSKMKSPFQNCNSEGLKPLSSIQFASPQTNKIKLDPPVQPDRGGEQINFKDEEVNQSEQVVLQDEVNQNESKKTKEKQSEETISQATEKKDLTRDVVQEKSKSDIPIELVERLEELEIPLDEKVISAINSHHISQAYGAAAHVENTWETINNPRGVFLFQLPKQKIEQLGTRLPEIGPKIREEYAAIEEEMATDEYKQKAQEMFAQLRAKLGKKGKKK